MKLDIGPVRSTYVTPVFGRDDAGVDPALRRRIRRPMVIGGLIIAVLVVGLGLWASLAPLASGLTMPGEVRVESNRKTLRHREAGTIRQILVREGQRVAANQPLIVYDDIEARASYNVLQNQYDSLSSQSARLSAEATGRPSLRFAPELTARMSDPNVAGMIRDQQFLFASRQQLYESQSAVLNQRLEQIANQIEGDMAQVRSVDEQRRLTADEMAGYQTLYEKGYAPKNLILRYQRSMAELNGRKGSLIADMSRLRQQMGETRMQLNGLRDQRQSQAAEQMRDTESKMTDMAARLAAARQALDETVVRSPVDGYVFNLTQFTVGGVTGGGEVLMDLVPADAPLMITAYVRPDEISEMRVGMDARVHLPGLGSRWQKPLPAKVTLVSADKIVNEKTNQSGYRVDLRIDPKDLKLLKRGAELTPGMPVSVMVVTGKRTIMGFLISPITETIHNAFREQ